ncbi:MAG: aldose epimerase family protein [Alistipes sp.]
MEIEQLIWGMTAEGEAIVLYTLRNSAGAEVRLCNYGAAVVAATMPDRTGHMDDVVLGYRHFESYFGDAASCGKCLGRCAGRTAYGQLPIAGEEHRLEINHGAHHLNGGTKGFANRLWEGRVETNRVVMSLTSEEGDQGYPGVVNVEVIFDFDDDNTLEITYLSRTDRPTAVNLTHQIYLNLAGEAAGEALDHEVQINATQALELDDEQLPTGRFVEVADTPQDFRTMRSLRTAIDANFNHIHTLRGYNHPFVIAHWQPHILTDAATLRCPQSGRCVNVQSSHPCVVLDTGNRLAGGCPETKSGGRYANHAGVALVCQNHPDAVHHADFPTPLLQADELYCQKIIYRFGTY